MDSKKFWDRVKPVFDNKMKAKDITLVENRKLIISEKQLAKTFKEYFVDMVPNTRIRAINLSTYEYHETNNIVLINLKYKGHPSIKAVTNSITQCENIFFRKVSEKKVIEEIKNLNAKKAA